MRSDLQPEDVVLRFGLHWGANLYVGNISTAGRSEVNALGDQVNKAARIEACASGGLALASKDLIERLEPDAAAALDLEPDRVTYTALGDLVTATEKHRRDAPAIAVCESTTDGSGAPALLMQHGTFIRVWASASCPARTLDYPRVVLAVGRLRLPPVVVVLAGDTSFATIPR